MTQAEWLISTDPRSMLSFLRDKASDRKRRLFSVACCRRIWHLFRDQCACKAVEVAERYADGNATIKELKDVHYRSSYLGHNDHDVLRRLIFDAASGATIPVADAQHAANYAQFARCYVPNERFDSDVIVASRHAERNSQAVLLRHIIGNPFRSLLVPPYWPSTVAALATALYDGEECHYALADALMEAGHVELAEHFQEPEHPKGCWALDVILGKQ